jgi:hypothetical protein
VSRESVGDGARVGFRDGRRPRRRARPTGSRGRSGWGWIFRNCRFWPTGRSGSGVGRLGSSPRRGKRWTPSMLWNTRPPRQRDCTAKGAVDDLVGYFAKHVERLALSAAGCKRGGRRAGATNGRPAQNTRTGLAGGPPRPDGHAGQPRANDRMARPLQTVRQLNCRNRKLHPKTPKAKTPD